MQSARSFSQAENAIGTSDNQKLEQVAGLLDADQNRQGDLIERQRRRAEDLVLLHRAVIAETATVLMAKQQMAGDEVREIFGSYRRRSAAIK